MSYFRKKWKPYCLWGLNFLSFNGYFIFLMRDRHVAYLLYLDFLLGVIAACFCLADWLRFHRRETEKKRLLLLEDCITTQLVEFENRDIAEHDVRVMQKKLQESFNESCELQDFVAKWCHELKLPLSAALLLNEKIKDPELRKAMREQLEKMNGQLNSLLLGCKLQSPLFDLQIKPTDLPECVRTSVKNNQFFLIQGRFTLDIRVEEIQVYTDQAWLVYILDQLINNSLKYAGNISGREPQLHIWTEREGQKTKLYVEDNGVGISEKDIRRIFEKGFTGSNYHNGKYRSTGLGLYMAARIARRMEHELTVESEYGAYARFCITFRQNDYYKE